MAKRMLIDATHPEETRVVVADGNRVEDFDFESATRKQLSGNIYLAKVTRVEPSLQAAFVEYGGNRHGFLAFNEIHPDYYQIPVADREALLAQEADEDAEDDDNGNGNLSETPAIAEKSGDDDDAPPPDSDVVETVGAEDAFEETKRKKPRQRPYKIQEVTKRRQIMLVQVVKEERGNKGAALTTYLSLAGRYCVLMPNTARGGGISRKITNAADRKRLKKIATELDIPKGTGLIIRTAGAQRTKAEIKRDCEYLLRLWDTVREQTLESSAPCLVYEEGSLIKRSIRDLYSKDIEGITVDGEDAYREAKDFMKMLTPSHAKNVQQYKERTPLYTRHRIESQLDALLQPTVQLKSGGYIVIDPTEALVSIDVNSGKSTKEHSIEETALKTNLEAAAEVSRQLRLRDMAGLIVIDFIDMDENRNNRAVERKLKDSLKNDRARIQVGRISSFGLMEMSRQRLRPGVLEATTQLCSVCHGTGLIRSLESTILFILRHAEEEGLNGKAHVLRIIAPIEVANFLLNKKRSTIQEIEERYGMRIEVDGDPALQAPNYQLERSQIRDVSPIAESDIQPIRTVEMDDIEDEETDDRPRKRRRRRRGKGQRDDMELENDDWGSASDDTDSDLASDAGEDGDSRKRRRGRRGGRKRSGRKGMVELDGVVIENRESLAAFQAGLTNGEAVLGSTDEEVNTPAKTQSEPAEKPAKKHRIGRKKPEVEEAIEVADAAEPEAVQETSPEPVNEAVEINAEPAVDLSIQEEEIPAAPELEPIEVSLAPEPENEPVAEPEPEPVKPARRDWWKSRFGLGK